MCRNDDGKASCMCWRYKGIMWIIYKLNFMSERFLWKGFFRYLRISAKYSRTFCPVLFDNDLLLHTFFHRDQKFSEGSPFAIRHFHKYFPLYFKLKALQSVNFTLRFINLRFCVSKCKQSFILMFFFLLFVTWKLLTRHLCAAIIIGNFRLLV